MSEESSTIVQVDLSRSSPAKPPPDRQCTRVKRNGRRCEAWAVEDSLVCFHHGASNTANQNRQRAKSEVALRELVPNYDIFGTKEIHPAQALLDLVAAKAAEVDYWKRQVSLLEDHELTWGITKEKTGGDDWGETWEAKPSIALEMLHRAEKDLAAYSAAALRAGVDEARVRLQQSQAEQALGVVRRALDLAGVPHDKAQAIVLQSIQQAELGELM